jgi:acetyl esterase/lipase
VLGVNEPTTSRPTGPAWRDRVDPELAVVLPLLPQVSIDDPDAARAYFAELIAQLPGDRTVEAELTIEDRSVPGPGAGPEVVVRTYRPRAASGPLPAVLWIHGGGFVVGSIEAEHLGCVQASRALGALVVSVEYRLAPEHPFPAGVEDCYAALQWLGAHARDLGVAPDRIAVAGSSAGGGLAAAVALMARDRGGPRLCFQMLNIPELDDRLETASMRGFTDTPMWNRPNAELSWRYYLGVAEGSAAPRQVSPYAAPSRAEDLSGLPPAYVATAELDPLRDEGIAYALALLQAGVPVELHHFAGTFHGSALVTTAEVSRRQQAEILDALRRGLGA